MAISFSSLAEVYAAPFDDVIDVRSPAEYLEDHIPGALSLPVLSNDQRAQVGTIYTQDSPFKARKIGAAMVARNAAAHIEGPLAAKDGAWQPLIYCWRGGQRSGSFASILEQIGWRAKTIVGGYQSYRRLIVNMLHDSPLPHRFILLDGNTGTAKTDILKRVAGLGGQTLDLEGAANHRGSLFGGTNSPQPAQKQFESQLAQALTRLDPTRPTLVEAESSKIGALLLPTSLWAAMRASPRIAVKAPVAARARYLTQAYADLIDDRSQLAATLDQLVAFHGNTRVGAWKVLAGDGKFELLAEELIKHHYDGRYSKSRAARSFETRATLDLTDLGAANLERAAQEIMTYLEPVAV